MLVWQALVITGLIWRYVEPPLLQRCLLFLFLWGLGSY
jgi:hypothetical protein